MVTRDVLEFLSADPIKRAWLNAPPDDEPVTEVERMAIERALDHEAHGRVIRHDEVLREFGLK